MMNALWSVDQRRLTYLNNSCVTASTAASDRDTTKRLMLVASQ